MACDMAALGDVADHARMLRHVAKSKIGAGQPVDCADSQPVPPEFRHRAMMAKYRPRMFPAPIFHFVGGSGLLLN
jgi:hypothetical protein